MGCLTGEFCMMEFAANLQQYYTFTFELTFQNEQARWTKEQQSCATRSLQIL
jgi:hypothetical protein